MNTTKVSYKKILMGALLLCGFGLPQVSWAVSSCNNSYLSGTYNAQINNASMLGNMSSNAGNAGFFANSPNSLASQTPGLGRFYFDGGGNVIGRDPNGVVANVIVGSYNVNPDCTMTMQTTSGQTFNAVLTTNGAQVLFLETDAGGNGATGTLTVSPNFCGPSYMPSSQSYGFAYSGAEAVIIAQDSDVQAGTPSMQPYSAVGTLTLDGSGAFAMTQWVFSSGAVQQNLFTGTYTIGGDCSLALSYNPDPSAGASTGTPAAPAQFSVILANGGSGNLVVTPPQGTGLAGQIANASKVQQ